MPGKHWTEYYEGKAAFDRSKDPWHVCPYNSNGVDAARHMEWMEGWEAAKRDDDDDDDGGGRGGGGYPSTTGNPSGGGRWND